MSQAENLLNSLIEEYGHTHTVTDSDTYFLIDPDTREIRNNSRKKNVLMQYDHNSQVYTFAVPRYIEGHDMSLCNKVYVHFDNIEDDTDNENSDIDELEDLRIDPEDDQMVICSWTISRNSTQLNGVLAFLIQYACENEDGSLSYEWHTDEYSDVEIRKGKNNNDKVYEKNSNLLAKWKSELEEKIANAGSVKTVNNIKPDEYGNVDVTSSVEEMAFDLLVQMGMAPVILDHDGAVLVDADGAILLNV